MIAAIVGTSDEVGEFGQLGTDMPSLGEHSFMRPITPTDIFDSVPGLLHDKHT